MRKDSKYDESDGFKEDVDDLFDDAAERAEANDRKTVQPRELSFGAHR